MDTCGAPQVIEAPVPDAAAEPARRVAPVVGVEAAAFGGEPQWVGGRPGIGDVGGRVGRGSEAEGVECGVAGSVGVVVAVEVVVEACFRVGVLSGKAERGVGGGVAVPPCGPPGCRSAAPGRLAGGGDKFGGGAGEVGDDGEGTRVGLGVVEESAFVLDERAVSIVFPGQNGGSGLVDLSSKSVSAAMLPAAS